jgi:cell division protein FtsX
VNRLFYLFSTIHIRRKKIYYAHSAGAEKWFIIVKFDYYELFVYSVGDALRVLTMNSLILFFFL